MATSLSGKEECGLSRMEKEMLLIRQARKQSCLKNSVSGKVHVPVLSKSRPSKSRPSKSRPSKLRKDVSDSLTKMLKEATREATDDSNDYNSEVGYSSEDSLRSGDNAPPPLRGSRNTMFAPPSLSTVEDLFSNCSIGFPEDPVHVSVPQKKSEYEMDEFHLKMNNFHINMQARQAEAHMKYETTLRDARRMAEEAIAKAEKAIAEGHQVATDEYYHEVRREFIVELIHLFTYTDRSRLMYAMNTWRLSVDISSKMPKQMDIAKEMSEEMVTVHNLAFNRVLEGFLTRCWGDDDEPQMPGKHVIDHAVKSINIFQNYLGEHFDRDTHDCLQNYFVPVFVKAAKAEIDTSTLHQAIIMLDDHIDNFRRNIDMPPFHTMLLDYPDSTYDTIMNEINCNPPEEIQKAVKSMLAAQREALATP